jgi:heme-degrading monooxygenase HmoA
MAEIRFIKHNTIYYQRPTKRAEAIAAISEFFGTIEGKVKGMRGYAIIDGIEDHENESVILTFWETKEDMDTFYSQDNKLLADLVRRLEPLFERMPKRGSYSMIEFKVQA